MEAILWFLLAVGIVALLTWLIITFTRGLSPNQCNDLCRLRGYAQGNCNCGPLPIIQPGQQAEVISPCRSVGGSSCNCLCLGLPAAA